MRALATDSENLYLTTQTSPKMFKLTFNYTICLLALLLQTQARKANTDHPHAIDALPTSAKWTPATAPCNVHVCFAMEGSDTITWGTYQRQKSFVGNVVRLISRRHGSSAFAAVQYGISNHAVSPLTEDVSGFLTALAVSSPVREQGSFVSAGLNYCFGELQHVAVGRKKIVLLGDGRRTIGSDPGDRANLFFSTGGEVLVVGVGWRQDWNTLKEIAGGDPSKVFSIRPTDSVWIESNQLVDELCTRQWNYAILSPSYLLCVCSCLNFA